MFLISFLLLFSGLQNASFQSEHSRLPISNEATARYLNTLEKSRSTESQPSEVKNDPDSLTYSAAKNQVSLLRIRLRNDFTENRIDIDSVKRTFNDRLTNQIIPYWYGTAWSFAGHSSVPKEGKIACGYFISTTLKDMGLKLNRYKLAQKSPIDEARALSCGNEIATISHVDLEQVLKNIKQHIQNGIYFIGFDTGHVGFLVKKKDTLFLAHSNYLSPVSVCIEPVETAKVFRSFNTFYLVDISHNERLIKKWLNEELVL